MYKVSKPLLLSMMFTTQLLSMKISYAVDEIIENKAKAIITLPVNAQTSAMSDHKKQLIEKLKKINFFSAGFEQKTLDEKGNVLQEGSGELAVSKPNLVHWNTKTPDESLIVSDGSTLWVYDPFIEQAIAYKLVNAIANTPILLLTSDDQALWAHYRVSQIDQATYLIHADDVNSQIKTLELHFVKDKLSGFTFLDATGQLSIISLKEVDFTTAPALDLFQFVLPEGTHLDDQR
ncbi:MAG: outer membrane lipoprotein carrier protein [Alteromonadaceae bacterium]|jgi:outer membrane lipoprotein carrier protein